MKEVHLHLNGSVAQLVDAHNFLISRLHKSRDPLTIRSIIREINSAPQPPIFVFEGFNANERRRAVYPPYKVRAPKEAKERESIYPFLELISAVLPFTKAIMVKVDGWEADDVIATLALASAKCGNKVRVVTRDRDMTQLAVHPNIELTTEPKDGLAPSRVRLFKTLCGDSSDKIPGVPFFGPKGFEACNKDEFQFVLECGTLMSDTTASTLGITASRFEWVEKNFGLLADYWNIIGLFDVPMDDIQRGMTIGKQDMGLVNSILEPFMQ